MSDVQHQGSLTVVQLLRLSRLPIRSLQNGAVPFCDIHEVLRSVSHDPIKSQRPASFSVSEPTRLSTNTRIVPSSSCIEGKPAVKPCSYRLSPSYILSRPRASLILNSSNKATHLFASLSLLMSHRTTVPPPECAFLTPTPRRWSLSVCSARLAHLLLSLWL